MKLINWLKVWNLREVSKYFPTVDIPDYGDKGFFVENCYIDNITKKGTINKRNPRIYIGKKIYKYKSFEYEIIAESKLSNGKEVVLVASTHTDVFRLKCFVVTTKDNLYNGEKQLIQKLQYDRKDILELKNNELPKEVLGVLYDFDDNVLVGSSMIKGLVSYNFIKPEYSKDKKPIYLSCTVNYDGVGNNQLKDKSLIKDFENIKRYLEQ